MLIFFFRFLREPRDVESLHVRKRILKFYFTPYVLSLSNKFEYFIFLLGVLENVGFLNLTSMFFLI